MSDIPLSRLTNPESRDNSDATIDVGYDSPARRKMMHWMPLAVPMMAALLAAMAAVILSQLGPLS